MRYGSVCPFSDLVRLRLNQTIRHLHVNLSLCRGGGGEYQSNEEFEKQCESPRWNRMKPAHDANSDDKQIVSHDIQIERDIE